MKKRRRKHSDDGSRLADEASYVCDACGESIVVPIDLSAGASQRYVEDCPVCCHPNVITVEVDEDGSARAWSEPE
jgi:transcription elongation factor Elf1